jgi:predicted glycosyltransferase
MKIIFYCQHVLGLGHLFRILELCRALDGHDVILVTGGQPMEVPLPPFVREVALPPLMMGRNLAALHTVDAETDIEDIRSRRRRTLLKLFQAERPQLFIVELFPFGRRKFRFELDPVLEAIRMKKIPKCKVICSLRDILVEREDRIKFETRVVTALNRDFDALLMHADPNLVRLEETFGRVADIHIPIIYTGFVTPKPPPESRQKLRHKMGLKAGNHLVVVSAGGGKVGGPLLEAALEALLQLAQENKLIGRIFTGPYLDQDTFDRLVAKSSARVMVQRFTSNFPAHLAAADLSISMAGYNTCMNILAAGITALVWPFAHGREQRRRANMLTKLGQGRILETNELNPPKLKTIISESLVTPAANSGHSKVDLDGARTTAAWIAKELKIDCKDYGRPIEKKVE